MALTKTPIELSSTPSIVDGGNATAITIDSSENSTFAGTVNGLTLASGGVTGPNSSNFTLNTANSVRINIDSNDSATGESFIVGHNQTAINQSNILFKVQDSGYAEFTGAADVRVTFGSTGTAGNNDSNWIRGEGSDLAFNTASGDHKWEVGGTAVARLDADGLRFGSDTAAANGLDDYEEGSWTPTATTSNDNGSFSVTVNFARYIKVGSLVHASCYLSINVSNVGSGAAIIGGLPFVNTSGQGYSIASVGHASAVALEADHSVVAYVTNGHSYIRHVQGTSTGNVGWAAGNPKYYMMSCTYHSV